MLAYPVNQLIGQKACGCATVTLIYLKADRAEVRRGCKYTWANWNLCASVIKRFQDASVTSLRVTLPAH
eukprot:6209054-Pleurochrysis_carterae.AAC.1